MLLKPCLNNKKIETMSTLKKIPTENILRNQFETAIPAIPKNNEIKEISSKYVILQQNTRLHNSKETYIPTSLNSASGIGNIVIVATEPVNLNNSDILSGSIMHNRLETNNQNDQKLTFSTDEDLTSLTWLQDKNLIKGIVARNGDQDKASISSVNFVSETTKPFDSQTEVITDSFTQSKNKMIPTHSIQVDFSNPQLFKTSNHNQMKSVASVVNSRHSSTSQETFVGANGTTTIVEYKSKSPFKTQTMKNMMKDDLNYSLQNKIVITSKATTNTFQSLSDVPKNDTNKYPMVVSTSRELTTDSSTVGTQHPHKKYLRDKRNEFEYNKDMNDNKLDIGTDCMEIQNDKIGIEYQKDIQVVEKPNFSKSINHLENLNSSSIVSSMNLNTNTSQINFGEKQFVTQNRNSFSEVHLKDYNENNHSDEIYKQNLVAIPIPNKTFSNTKSEQNLSQATSIPTIKPKLSTSLAYDPKTQSNAKPPYSFSSLIFMAIEDSPEKALPVKEIYSWIVQHFPYFKTAPTGWKNSVRHNLSLNKSFLKVEKAPNMGKGSLWKVEQHQRPNLIQALTRSPFYPCPAIDKFSTQKNISGKNNSNIKTSYKKAETVTETTPVKSNLDAKLFPKLSKLMKEMGSCQNSLDYKVENTTEIEYVEQNEIQSDSYSHSINVSSNNSSEDQSFSPNTSLMQSNQNGERLSRNCGTDNIDDVNAATAMLALKHGSKIYENGFDNSTPVITNIPSADHTYSAGNASSNNINDDMKYGNQSGFEKRNEIPTEVGSPSVSSDAAYESSDDSRNLTPDEIEYQRTVEGVDALLSLSSICSHITESSDKNQLKHSGTTHVRNPELLTENVDYASGNDEFTFTKVSQCSPDEGYNTQGCHSQLGPFSSNSLRAGSLSTFRMDPFYSPPLKKIKTSKLRSKIKEIKRKTTALR